MENVKEFYRGFRDSVMLVLLAVVACFALGTLVSRCAAVPTLTKAIVPAVETVRAVEECLLKCDGQGHLVDQVKRANCTEQASAAVASWCEAGILICDVNSATPGPSALHEQHIQPTKPTNSTEPAGYPAYSLSHGPGDGPVGSVQGPGLSGDAVSWRHAARPGLDARAGRDVAALRRRRL